MTGSEMGKFFGVFLVTPSLVVAGIFTLLGLAVPPIGTFCFVVAAICACFAAWLVGSIKFVEIARRKSEAQDRAHFAASNPGLHSALVAIETLCECKPGYKRIRFHTETNRGMPGDQDIIVYAFADTWTAAGDASQPVTVAGVPVEEWKQGFPEEIDGYSLGLRFASSPISLGWPGGLGAGIWK